MNRPVSFLILLALVTAGCQHPDEVHLTPGPDDATTQMEINSIVADSTGHGVGDSSTVLQQNDQTRFGAILSVQRIVDDYVAATVRNVGRVEFSSVVFTDRSRPVLDSIQHYGYWGLQLATVKLNSLSMTQVRHLIHVPVVGNVPAGYEYFRLLNGTYQPGQLYTWTISIGGTDSTSFSVTAPKSLSVQSPVGGSRIPRNVPLDLRWTGTGNLTIIVSQYFPLLKKSKPLFSIVPAINAGHLIVPPRVLELFRARAQYLVFTFMLENRNVPAGVTAYPGKVLVLASDVYNSYVELL
jgi:hypothetical protein